MNRISTPKSGDTVLDVWSLDQTSGVDALVVSVLRQNVDLKSMEVRDYDCKYSTKAAFTCRERSKVSTCFDISLLFARFSLAKQAFLET